MSVAEMREKTISELNQQLQELKQQSFALTIQKTTGQLTATHKIRQVRRQIAQVMTIISEKGCEQ